MYSINVYCICMYRFVYSVVMQLFFAVLGRKSAVNTCAYSRDGSLIAGALYDGSIQIWKNSPPFVSDLSSVLLYV